MTPNATSIFFGIVFDASKICAAQARMAGLVSRGPKTSVETPRNPSKLYRFTYMFDWKTCVKSSDHISVVYENEALVVVFSVVFSSALLRTKYAWVGMHMYQISLKNWPFWGEWVLSHEGS